MKLKKIRQTHNINLYVLLWIVALVITVYLLKDWSMHKQLIGVVESKSHQLSAGESGRLQNVLISIGDSVQKDQVLATLDLADLKTNLDRLKEQLTSLQKYESAQRDRFSIEVQSMRLQLENEASALIERLSLIESKSTELAGLNGEIARLQSAGSAGLGYSRDLADLILQRDALETYLREQNKDLDYHRQQLEKTRQSRKILKDADMNEMTRSLLLEQMEYAEELQRLVVDTEYRVSLRTIVAPCDGYVTEMWVRQGDIVDRFTPIFTVEETKPKFLDVYIPEQSNLAPQVGMKVEIFSTRSKANNTTGFISFVHPGFAMISERLAFRGQFFWARKVRIELPEEHQLIPGEIVKARISRHDKSNSYLNPSAEASEIDTKEQFDQPKENPPLKNMDVQKSLWEKTRFEPSGIAWLPDIGKYLIVSDDTGIKETPSDHAAYVFLMDENGKVDSTPVPLIGIGTVNDLEAIAPAGDNTFYLISSQNISKRGKRPGSRELILKVKREGEKFVVQGKIRLLSLLLEAYPLLDLKNLGLDRFDSDGQPVLNIEGAAFHDKTLYLGLKEPVSPKGAIIWKIKDVDDIFTTQKLALNQISLYAYIPLGQYKNKTAGISDLAFDQNNNLWILSTIVDAAKDGQLGSFFRIDRTADGRFETTRFFSFPGLKPEGICPNGPNRFLIAFDMDNENPLFCNVDIK
ncbi:efflux RND transporter periplasmic adaptor subunit [candidate division KSB1 bacterium]|nr:efflux RND transporter periplasmic adaptor subunit [candidate division KSB1 bacterium]